MRVTKPCIKLIDTFSICFQLQLRFGDFSGELRPGSNWLFIILGGFLPIFYVIMYVTEINLCVRLK